MEQVQNTGKNVYSIDLRDAEMTDDDAVKLYEAMQSIRTACVECTADLYQMTPDERNAFRAALQTANTIAGKI